MIEHIEEIGNDDLEINCLKRWSQETSEVEKEQLAPST